MDPDPVEDDSARWRINASAMMGVGWVVFMALWWALSGDDYTRYQNLAIAIASAIILGGVVAALWIPWSYRHDPDAWRVWGLQGFIVRIVWSMAVFLGLATVFLWWLWYVAPDYDIDQNFTFFVIIVAALCGLVAPVWVRWGREPAVAEGAIPRAAKGRAEAIDMDKFMTEVQEAVDKAIEDAKAEMRKELQKE